LTNTMASVPSQTDRQAGRQARARILCASKSLFFDSFKASRQMGVSQEATS
jgi:hypothetical protein